MPDHTGPASSEGDSSMSYLEALLRLLLAGVFLVAGTAKIFAHADARDMLTGLFPLGRRTATWSAWSLAVAELAIGGALTLAGAMAVPALILALGLLTGFCAAAVRAIRRKDTAMCACFGRAKTPFGQRHLYRNTCLVAAAATCL